MARVHIQQTFLIFLLAFVANNTTPSAAGPVLDEELYPFVLNLVNNKYDRIICGATLITPTCALTTAHCLPTKDTDDLIITHETSGKKIIRKIERTVIPEEYELKNQPLNEHDFAVLVLDKPYDYEEARTVVINFNPVMVDDTITFVGWNRTLAKLETPSSRIATEEECLKKLSDVTAGMLCAPIKLNVGTSGRTIVNARQQQVGIVSVEARNDKLNESLAYFIKFSNPKTLAFLNETILSNCNGRNNL